MLKKTINKEHVDTAYLHELEQLGLSDKEAKTYLALMRLGAKPTAVIAKEAGLNRGTTYVALHALLSKGLVVKSAKRGVQQFNALEPEALDGYLDRREKEIVQQRKNVQALVPGLKTLISPLATLPKVEFFEGPEGARAALERTLRAKDKILRSFLSLVDVCDFLGADFFDRYTNARIKAGYFFRGLRTAENEKEAFKINALSRTYGTSKRRRREVRHISAALAFPMTQYLYDDKVLIVSSKRESFALLVTSKEYADMQKKLFDLIWDSAPVA